MIRKNIVFAVLLLLMWINAYSQDNFEVVIDTNGGRIDWSDVNNRIAIDRKGDDGFYNIYTMNPDTSNILCLTCDTTIAPKHHSGNPSWYPSGEYILFQAESDSTTEEWQHNISTPGRGRYNDVWVMDSAGTTFINLTNIPYNPSPTSAVLHPQFSHDGTKICWAQRIGDSGPKGQWRIKVADFVENSGSPYIENIQTYHPLGGNNFYETHAFSQNGEEILYSATLHNREFHTLEVYTFNILTEVFTNLTNYPGVWDEHAHYNKTEDKIVWMSSNGYTIDTTDFSTLRTEWWIMNTDGTNKQQISHFNDSGYPEYIPDDVAAGDIAFSPDSSKFFGYIITETSNGGTGINVLADLDKISSIKNVVLTHNFRLEQNYPNPFDVSTEISYELNEPGKVRLSIYNILGERIKTLINTKQSVGCFSVEWDGTDNQGAKAPSGIYIYQLRSNLYNQNRKMVLIR